jgi:hypothetical protein
VEAVMHEIRCIAPVGAGMITLRGDAGLPGVHRVDVSLKMDSVPVSAVAQLARRAKKDLPADLVSTGTLEAGFTVKEDGPTPRGPEFQGQGEITNLRLQSTNTKVDFAAGSVPFVLSSGRGSVRTISKGKSGHPVGLEILPAPDELHIEYGPFPVALGRPVPAQARGWVARSGYGMVIRGEGEVSRTLRMARLLGLPAAKASVEGVAQMELQIAGPWAANVAGNVSATDSAFSLLPVTGTVHLRDVKATVRGVNQPIEISSAEVQLSLDEVRVEKLKARAAGAEWMGTMAFPRGCGAPGACLVRFSLNAEEIGMDELHAWLGSQPSQRRWYQLLTSSAPAVPTFIENLRASGKMSASRLRIRSIVANRVSATVELERGKLKISGLQADVLGGKHRGEWQADFTGKTPAYSGSGTLTGISLERISEAMSDPWISGTGAGSYEVTASGADAAEFWQSAEGGLEFDLRDGTLPHISLAGDEGPLQVAHWKGRARLRAAKIEIEKGTMVSPTGSFEISGTASLGRELDLKLTRSTDVGAGSMVYSITGTLAEPRVELTTAETQARLKP